jgi:predicted oxidoreductase
MRFRNSQAKMMQWEKILGVMLSGDAVSKETLEVMPEMQDVPLYRLSTFIWRIKMTGGVVRVVKNGRKIDGYQLMNTAEMQKYFNKRTKFIEDEQSKKEQKQTAKQARATAKVAKPAKVKKTKAVKKLKDLNAQPVQQVKVTVPPKAHIDLGIADIQVEEITEQE